MPEAQFSEDTTTPVSVLARPEALPPIVFEAALIRGLLRWQTATLGDGRAALVLTLDVPGGAPEVRQILLHRTTARDLGGDVAELETAPHLIE